MMGRKKRDTRIDEIVDDQLGHERSGYDHNINQQFCGHCDRDWHGLPVREAIAGLCYVSLTDPRFFTDDSKIVCNGSTFIGPMATPPVYNPRIQRPGE